MGVKDKVDMPHIICLMGPTASGKTDVAIRLVETANCEIISVDSAQVYRGMDIGTAKPSAEELNRAPHHLISILDPVGTYSAASFRSDALALIKDISARHKTPLLVGGTFLYFRALLQGLAELPEADQGVRFQLEAEYEKDGLKAMHKKLQAIDPVTAKRLHANDKQRVFRALEVYEISGETLSSLINKQQTQPLPFTVSKIALYPEDRGQLHRRIKKRFQFMLDKGLVHEVEGLTKQWKLDLSMSSMRSVGYRQALKFLLGQYSLEEMQERAVIATRQLAKRQYTWLRSETDITGFDPQSTSPKTIAEKIAAMIIR